MSKIRRVFPGGNTSQGFFSFHDNIIDLDRNMLYILKGMPGGGKSSLMKDTAIKALNDGYSIEYHHCPSDPESIDGVVIEELKVAIVDGTPPHSIDPVFPGLTDKIIDLTRFIDDKELEKHRSEIFKAKANNKEAYRKAFNYFKTAGVIYSEIFENNKKLIDHKRINKETKNLIDRVLSSGVKEQDFKGFYKRHLFSAAYTPEGYVDYTDSILDLVGNIIYIKGDLGTGRSDILNDILNAAKLRNYHIEIFHDPLIPSNIESLFIKELDTIITSNKNADNFNGLTLDLNKYFNKDKSNKEDYEIFNMLLDKGTSSLNSASENHFILEQSYKTTVNYEEINKIKEWIYKDILSYKK